MSDIALDIAVIGEDEFTLGFRLAGLQRVIHYHNDNDMNTLLRDDKLGIVITSNKTFEKLHDARKEDVMKSIKPVVVVVSDEPQEELRKMIIRSIGVDLLKN